MEVVGERPPPLPPKSRVNQLKMNFQLKPSVKQSVMVGHEEMPERDDAGGFYLKQSPRKNFGNASNSPESKIAGFFPLAGSRGSMIRDEDPHPEVETANVICVNGAKFAEEPRRPNFSSMIAKFAGDSGSFGCGRESSIALPSGGAGKCPGECAGPKIVSWAQKSAGGEDRGGSGDSSLSFGSHYKVAEPENGKQEEEMLYQNVSNAGTNYIEYKLNGIISKNLVESKEKIKNCKNHNGTIEISDNSAIANYQSGKSDCRNLGKPPGSSDNRQIEVRQVKNKTVVKISIKDNFVENQTNGVETQFRPLKSDVKYYAEYAEPFVDADRSPKTVKNLKCDANYRNCDEMNYANLQQKGCREDHGENGDDQLYVNLNASDPECDQTYENYEFEILKNSRITQGVIEKNSNLVPVPNEKSTIDLTDKDKSMDEQIYENQMFGGDEDAYENINIKITQNGLGITREVLVQDKTQKSSATIIPTDSKPCLRVNVNKTEREGGQHEKPKGNQHLSVSNEVRSHEQDAAVQKLKSSKVVVTISSLQPDKNDSDDVHSKKSVLDDGENDKQPGHKRAESLTSSGVGVDSEESDCEGSNISCDSLNSNELNALSTSEDHGYHTPNSENKTGSPVYGVDYQNVNSEQKDGRYASSSVFPVTQADLSGDAYENVEIMHKSFEARNGEETCGNTQANEKRSTFKKKQILAPAQKSNVAIVHRAEVDEREELKSLPKGLLRDIRSRSVKLSSAYPKGEKDSDAPEENEIRKKIITFSNLSGDGERKRETIRKEEKKLPEADDKRLKVEERTYEERKNMDVRSEKVNKICAMEVDTDKFYKFHLYENRNDVNGEKNGNEDETFAGVKDYLNREKQAAIKSAKGTIRGVKNRVKAGIATFLQMQENKTYKDRDAGKIVVYSTTMGIVRDTYHKCLKVKQILRTLMVKFEERDVFMSSDAQDEIRERMKCDAILVPQVFVEGQHIGDAETIERLNESGELRKILKPYKSPDACSTCHVCGGYRLLPCSICKGSKKSVHRNHFTAEFVALKCMNCDQVGLTKCYAC